MQRCDAGAAGRPSSFYELKEKHGGYGIGVVTGGTHGESAARGVRTPLCRVNLREEVDDLTGRDDHLQQCS